MGWKNRNGNDYIIEGLILVGCLLLILLFTGSPPRKPVKSSVSEDIGELTVPEGLDEYVDNPDVEWMAGMRVLLPGCTPASENVADNIDTYVFFDGTVEAELEIRNALNRDQRFSVMVLADGSVQPFTLAGQTYDQYFLSIKDTEKLEISLQPEFSLHAGRLDFLLLYQEETDCDFTMMNYTVCMEQPDTVDPVMLEDGFFTVPLREPLTGSAIGGSVLAWLWNTDDDLTQYATGQRTLICERTAPLILEAVSGSSAFLVMNLYYNGEVISFFAEDKEYKEIFWYADADTMISRKILFDHSEGGAFSVIITAPLDWERAPVRSWNVKLKEAE